MLTLSFFFFPIRGHRKHFESLCIHPNFWKILLFKFSFNIWSQTWKHSSLWTYCAYVKSLKPFLVFNPHKISQPSGFFLHQTVFQSFTVFLCVQYVYPLLMLFSMVLYLSSKWAFLLLCIVYLGINCNCAPNSYQYTVEISSGDSLLTSKAQYLTCWHPNTAQNMWLLGYSLDFTFSSTRVSQVNK